MTTHSGIFAWEIPWTESLAAYDSWGRKESDRTESLSIHCPPPHTCRIFATTNAPTRRDAATTDAPMLTRQHHPEPRVDKGLTPGAVCSVGLETGETTWPVTVAKVASPLKILQVPPFIPPPPPNP